MEKRKIQVHERFVLHGITRQAGNIMKAVLEGLMNASDAGATSCSVELDQKKLVIQDDGTGFKTREKIITAFEVLGLPPEDDEHKTYGFFRVGRGQLFAFGKNVWRSNQFRMEIDIKRTGLAYDLSEDKPVRGCRIEIDLYDELTNHGVATTVRDLVAQAQYMPLKITVNGKLISKDPDAEPWSFENELFKARWAGSGQLTLLNQGAFVAVYPPYKLGTGGLVYSKVPLTLNTARNDVMAGECRVWKALMRVTKNLRSTADTPSLAQRQGLIMDALADPSSADTAAIRLVTGRFVQLTSLLYGPTDSEGKTLLAFAKKNDTLGLLAQKLHFATVVDETFLADANISKDDIIEVLRDYSKARRPGCYNIRVATLEELRPLMQADDYEFVLEKDLGRHDTVKLSLIRTLYDCMIRSALHAEDRERGAYWRIRRVVPTKGIEAAMWTDGVEVIGVTLEFLRKMEITVSGLVSAAVDVARAGSFSTDTRENADPTAEASEKMLAMLAFAGDAVAKAASQMPSAAKRAGLTLSLTALKALDTVSTEVTDAEPEKT